MDTLSGVESKTRPKTAFGKPGRPRDNFSGYRDAPVGIFCKKIGLLADGDKAKRALRQDFHRDLGARAGI